MNSKSFVKLLRKIIKEEVQSAVREVLTEQVIDHNTPIHEIATPRPKKQFTKNSMLNDLLNETAGTPAAPEMAEWSTMNFRSEMANAFGVETAPAIAPTTGINGEAVNMQKEGVAATVNAMTKDYSALMKAINKKKHN
jgi:hypothetical protein